MKANQKQTNVNVNESANVVNNAAAASSEPQQKPILIDESKASANYKVKHAKEINERYTSDAPKGEEIPAGKLLAVYRAAKDSKKNGDKTFYKIEYNGVIFDGYSSTEFADANGIERRRYSKKNGESKTPSDNPTIIALRALKESIEKLNKIEKYKKMFTAVKVEDIETAIESEREQAKEISDFIAQRGTDIEDSTTYTEESKLLEEYGTKFVAKLKTYKLGFFAPKESQESQESQESK